MPPKTPQQREAADKYLKEKVDTIAVRVPKGKKEVISSHAEAKGESVNAFMNRAIDTQIAQDNEKARE